jgi:hypothetical protein
MDSAGTDSTEVAAVLLNQDVLCGGPECIAELQKRTGGKKY